MKGRAFDESEQSRINRGTSGLDLWTQAGETMVERQLERLIPIAKELAQKAGCHGVTISDVRICAVNRGVLTGEEAGKRLSYLGSVMEAAALVPTDGFRRSSIPKSHANLHRVFVAQEFAAA
jgi:hypothetical protein